ncbi:hypothetical protein [Rhizobium ruizarguesonis]|uniref:hypothetical protein n=1 Tax=Rhizobium ruizarguesonis TaxID=2081791 RepID=UPI00102F99C5|nr:hypothetical protein [Rhizobium ruizarguesonis]TBC84240.1 hypothetical protein ELH28_16360 [Rhizobium ruizarguesonis]
MKLFIILAMLFYFPINAYCGERQNGRSGIYICDPLSNYAGICSTCNGAPLRYGATSSNGSATRSQCLNGKLRYPEPQAKSSECNDITCISEILKKPINNKQRPDLRCALLEISPGATCIDGVVTDLLSNEVEARSEHIPDKCVLFDLPEGAMCINGVIVKLLEPLQNAADPNPCMYMEVSVGVDCEGGTISFYSLIEAPEPPSGDPCNYMEAGPNVTCENGVLSRTLDTGQPKIQDLQASDGWQERQELIANRDKIVAALKNNQVQKQVLVWREAGAYLKVVASYEANRIWDIYSASPNDPLAVAKVMKELIFDGPLGLVEKLDHVEKAFKKEKADFAKTEINLLNGMKEVDDAITTNEKAVSNELNEKARKEQEKNANDETARRDREKIQKDQQERDRNAAIKAGQNKSNPDQESPYPHVMRPDMPPKVDFDTPQEVDTEPTPIPPTEKENATPTHDPVIPLDKT